MKVVDDDPGNAASQRLAWDASAVGVGYFSGWGGTLQRLGWDGRLARPSSRHAPSTGGDARATRSSADEPKLPGGTFVVADDGYAAFTAIDRGKAGSVVHCLGFQNHVASPRLGQGSELVDCPLFASCLRHVLIELTAIGGIDHANHLPGLAASNGFVPTMH